MIELERLHDGEERRLRALEECLLMLQLDAKLKMERAH